MNFKRFNNILLVSLVASLCVIASINIVADPFYVFRTPLNSKINKIKPNITRQERITKILSYKMDRSNIDTIFVGSSRVDCALDPEYFNKQTGLNVKNMAIVGPDLVETIDYTETILKIHPEVKTIIMGLDFFGFREQKRDILQINRDKNIKPSELATVLFSFDALNSSITTIKENFTGKITRHIDKNGIRKLYTPENINEEFDKMLRAYINGEGYYKNYVLSKDKLIKLEEFNNYCKKSNIKLILYTNPIHITMLQAIKSAGSFDEFTEWKKQIANISNFYDFCYVNEITTELVNNNMQYYFEPCHYNYKVGNMVLDSIQGADTDFGHLITVENVDNYNHQLVDSFNKWQKKNPGIISMVGKLKK